MTAALLQTGAGINCIEVFDTAGSINAAEAAKKLTVQTEFVDVLQSAKVTPQQVADCPDPVEFAIAYGAALSFIDPPRSANWRSDFMPYQGRKMRLEKTFKFFAVTASILMFALGLYGLMSALQVSKYRTELRAKFAKEYAAVMFGQKTPDASKEAVRRLGTALRRVKEAQKGGVSLTGEEAVAGKLTLVLQAFNKCAAATGLAVDSVSITDKAITISGDTSSPDNTLKVFEAFRQTGLNVLQQRISSEGSRSNFNVTVEPQKGKAGE
jgi:cell division protein FtsL